MFSVRYIFRSSPLMIPAFPYFSTTAGIFFTPVARASLNSFRNLLSSFLFDVQQAKAKGSPVNLNHSSARSIPYLNLLSYSKHLSPISTFASSSGILIKSKPSAVLTHENFFFQQFFARIFTRLTSLFHQTGSCSEALLSSPSHRLQGKNPL